MASLRHGCPADLPVLISYWHDMLEECDLIGSGLVSDWAERLRTQFAADMEAGSGVWFVAEEDGGLVGTCVIFRQMGRSNISLDATGMLAGMYVAPAYRGRGIARELLNWALQWCRERGVKTVRLHASKMGRPLYESAGFRTATEMMRLDLR
jgi:GNAT superfamily N-acetyltransferase